MAKKVSLLFVNNPMAAVTLSLKIFQSNTKIVNSFFCKMPSNLPLPVNKLILLERHVLYIFMLFASTTIYLDTMTLKISFQCKISKQLHYIKTYLT